MRYSERERELLRAVGERIRSLRMCQEQLALESDLDRTCVGSVERGRRNIAVISLTKIASALGVSVTELLHGL